MSPPSPSRTTAFATSAWPPPAGPSSAAPGVKSATNPPGSPAPSEPSSTASPPDRLTGRRDQNPPIWREMVPSAGCGRRRLLFAGFLFRWWERREEAGVPFGVGEEAGAADLQAQGVGAAWVEVGVVLVAG